MKNLADHEVKHIIGIIEEYRKIHKELDNITNDIEKLQNKKTELLNKYINIKCEEGTFTEGLERNYGKGSLDLQSMTWIRKEIVNEKY
jgi:hypothetical protein